MQQDTRKFLTTGSTILATGLLSVALLFGAFGGATRFGPHTNGGWVMLVVALGCLPLGLLISVLGLAKLIGNRTRAANRHHLP